MKFGAILRKIVKIIATKCQILRLQCTEIDFGWCCTQTPLGSLQCFRKLPSWNKGDLLIREREWKGGGGKALGGKRMGIFKFS